MIQNQKTCHSISLPHPLELADKLLKGNHSYVVTTHVDTNSVHNHILFCSADNFIHKKFVCNKNTYRHIRTLSDRLCREHGLSVIENSGRKTGLSYEDWLAEGHDAPLREKVRRDIRECIKIASSYEDFIRLMREKDYEISGDALPDGDRKVAKYIRFRASGYDHFVRGCYRSLGKGFTKEEIAATKDQAEYDNACKNLFKNKEILAPVLKYAIGEYKDFTVEEIIGFIDGVSISIDTPVDDVSVMVDPSDTEMASLSDKLIRYDVRLRSLNPMLSKGEVLVHIHIDFEVQNNYRPSDPPYPMIKRGIYYGAREISSQLGVLTDETDYGKIEKVYSIWVCNQNIPAGLINTMDRYYIHKEHIIGQSEEPESDYDLMEVIMIRRGSNTGADAIFDYLSGVFNSDIRKISDYTDTKDNEEITREVTTMGGLGASIAQEASIRQLIEAYRDFNASDEEIIKKLMSKFGISEDIAKDYIKKFELQPV